MVEQSAAPAQLDRAQSGFCFNDVLQRELELIAARRKQLRTQRGELDAKATPENPSPQQPATETAWQGRLLGLSFSGGGIRSATFNLGVLQALARCGVLRYVDYLSTVSGGGYVGSWLTALTQRRFARDDDESPVRRTETDALVDFDASGFRHFEKGLAWAAGDKDRSGPDREDRAIRFLREYSNYLTPKLGLFSGDTWALVAIYLRNALLNQLVILLALAAVLLLPRLASGLLRPVESGDHHAFVLWMLAVFISYAFVCWNLGGNLARVTAPAGRDTETAPLVLRRVGLQLLFIGVSAASWLSYIGTWPWWLATVVGAVVSLVSWTLICASARAHSGGAWGEVEKTFWSRMLRYAIPSGLVFGLLLHGLSTALFVPETYMGLRLVAAPPALAAAILLAGVLHVGLAGKNVSSQYTEWLSRFGGLMLIGALGWLAVGCLVFLGPLIWAWLEGAARTAISSGWLLTTLASVVFGRSLAASTGRLPRLFMTVAPYIFIVGLGIGMAALVQAGLHAAVERYGGDTSIEQARDDFYQALRPAEEPDVFGRVEVGGASVAFRGRLVDDAAGAAAVPAAVPADGAGAAGDAARDLERLYGEWLAASEHEWILLGMIVLAAGLAGFVSWRVDVNVFSLNGMYANRLVRCYLGASVPVRKPNPFSGLSPRDDLRLAAVPRSMGDGPNMLVHPMIDGTAAGGEPLPDRPTIYPGPYHLVNTAINLVSGSNLAYQERKAGAFLLSPLFCGFQLPSATSEAHGGKDIDAYRPTEEFARTPRPITLGQAIATSGAAASPNMGYHSTPAFAFLMGVFNIRLGRWVGNPHAGDRREETWRKSAPKFGLFHLLREVFGLTDKESGFVYLSDGGHFENLGIYELVRRRCRYIIACDAGADGRYGFEDLGNAIRKCRTDLGVEIDLDVRQIAAIDGQRYNGAPCAVGTIRYSEREVGTILYIKASRRAGMPSDVMHYATENPAFPHEPTADQFFSESQFESYRRLGHFLASEILADSRAINATGVDVDQLFRDLSQRWYGSSSAIAANFGRLAERVDGLFERLRTSKSLEYLSKQFYPEWRNLLDDKVVAPQVQIDDLMRIPTDSDELREGFYFCNSLIQLMESVYVDLHLDTEWQHPDNSGWLNVFNHWAWSGMFRVTWAIAAATYGNRFRAFCEQRLNLTLGDVQVARVRGAPGEDAFAQSGLNAHEQRQIEALGKFVSEKARRPLERELTVYRLELHVRHPIVDVDHKPLRTFGFGYAVVHGDQLVLYRVQDHLRGMGLGRRGLAALVAARGSRRLAMGPLDDDDMLEFFRQYKEQTDRRKLADFRAMLASVNEERASR